MNNSIEVKVTTKHFKNATGYTDDENCPLAMAVKDVFPDALVIGVSIGNVGVITKKGEIKHFNVTLDWRHLQVIYGGQFKGLTIDNMIELAKTGTRIPTKTLVLKQRNLVG